MHCSGGGSDRHDGFILPANILRRIECLFNLSRSQLLQRLKSSAQFFVSGHDAGDRAVTNIVPATAIVIGYATLAHLYDAKDCCVVLRSRYSFLVVAYKKLYHADRPAEMLRPFPRNIQTVSTEKARPFGRNMQPGKCNERYSVSAGRF